VAEKPHDAIVKSDTCRNLQRHRTVLPAIAWLLLLDGADIACIGFLLCDIVPAIILHLHTHNNKNALIFIR